MRCSWAQAGHAWRLTAGARAEAGSRAGPGRPGHCNGWPVARGTEPSRGVALLQDSDTSMTSEGSDSGQMPLYAGVELELG